MSRTNTPSPKSFAFRISKVVLSVLSLIVPGNTRARWLKEWEGELAHRPTLRILTSALRDGVHFRVNRASLEVPAPRSVHPPGNHFSLSPILTDFRFGFRALRNAPWLSTVTALTLALGIGSSVAMFGVLYAAFLRPLPFPEASRLVTGQATFQGELYPFVAGADYYDYQAESDAFEELAAILPRPRSVTVTGGGEAERLAMTVVSPNLFPALGVQPLAGRFFQEGEGLEGGPEVVILSFGFWQRRMGGDPNAVGASLTLEGTPHTVVGVLPHDFFFLASADIWIPMRPNRYTGGSRGAHNWTLVGRLAPFVGINQAQASVDVISARLQEAYPETNATKGLHLSDLQSVLTADYHQGLWILTGATALVLLIACGNGAGILLARAPSRRFELSVRSAMGAPRSRLVRQLLAESMGLALAGGLLGTTLAFWLQGVMLSYLNMDRLGPVNSGIPGPVLAASLGLSLLVGLLTGAYPALKSAGGGLIRGMRTSRRNSGDGGQGFRSGLVVAQVALSVVLLAGSGLLVRSLTNLQSQDPGFDASNLLTARFQLPGARYPDATDRTRFLNTLRDELSVIPGVESVGLTTHLPIGDLRNVYGARLPGDEGEWEEIFLRPILPGYFQTLGIPLLAGRGIGGEDGEDTKRVVVLSRTATRLFYPEESALGRSISLGDPEDLEVVGVVGDVRLSRMEEEPEAALYIPYSQGPRSTLSLAMRTRVPPLTLAGTLKEALRRLDPEIALSRVATMESLVAESMAERRIITLSLTLLALLPLFLAAVGLFAVLAYHVSRRQHELGIRMALGADMASVGRMILAQGLGLVGIGLVLGMVGALAGTRLLRSLLFGVGATDPVTLATVATLVLGVAVLACAVPVWRATRSDPTEALQAE